MITEWNEILMTLRRQCCIVLKYHMSSYNTYSLANKLNLIRILNFFLTSVSE